MSDFHYRGRSGAGELVSGRLEADDPDGVATRLLNLGITPLEIAPVGAHSATVGEFLRKLGAGRPSTADLVLFARQMYSITKSGLPLLRGLRGLAQSTHNAVLRSVLDDVLRGLESGRDLASSLARHPVIFTPLFVSMVRVGESTGTLDNAFERLYDYLGHDQEIKERVQSAVRYPLLVVGAIAIAVAIITVFVIPNFAPLFKVLGNDIPWPTRVIIGTSDVARHHGIALIAVAVIGILAFRQHIRTEHGNYRWDRFKLKVPVLGELMRQSVLSRVTRSLSISIEAGLPMIQALTLLSQSAGNAFMAEQLLRLRDAVERGEPLSRAAAATGIFPPLVLQMVLVGEETGELTRLLAEVSGFYRREVDFRLRNLTSMLEPLLIAVVGGLVLILALGVFLPMWNMIGKIGHSG